MINGRFVMKDRELLTADEREVYSKARELAAAFWERA
jgi:hypothetical protein